MEDSLTRIKRIDSTDKIELIIYELQRYILGGNLKQGTELPAGRILTARLGVSRFSLREVLRAAQAEGPD